VKPAPLGKWEVARFLVCEKWREKTMVFEAGGFPGMWKGVSIARNKKNLLIIMVSRV